MLALLYVFAFWFVYAGLLPTVVGLALPWFFVRQVARVRGVSSYLLIAALSVVLTFAY